MMRVIFAIDVMGQSSELGQMLQLALQSCLDNTTLSPVVIAPSFLPVFRAWLDERNIGHIETKTRIHQQITELNRNTGYPLQALGNYLRYEACEYFPTEVILYCDCDVFFLRDPPAQPAPTLLAACGADSPDDFSSVNSGVLLINVPEMKRHVDSFLTFAGKKLEHFFPGYDQPALNDFFSDRIEKLPPELNWRSYWGSNSNASILHFHGFKCSLAEKLLQGTYEGVPERRRLVIQIVSKTLEYMPLLVSKEYFKKYEDFAYFRRLSALLKRAQDIVADPILSYVDGLTQEKSKNDLNLVRESDNFWDIFGENSKKIKLRSGTFSVANATAARLIFAEPNMTLGLSDLRSAAGVTVSSLKATTRGNTRLSEVKSVSGIDIYPVRPIDSAAASEFIYSVVAGTLEVQFFALTQGELSCKIYLSSGEGFSEDRSFWVSVQ